MGLDMYLHAEKFVSGSRFRGVAKPLGEGEPLADVPGMTVMAIESVPNERASDYETLIEMFGVKDAVSPDSPYANVKFTVAYWRKANHVHAWFVENTQGGVDRNGEYTYVSREQLGQLREACLRVLAAEAGLHGPEPVAAEHLPTAEGFFFGSTDYGEWYIADLKDTVAQIDRAMQLDDEWSFQYQSSW